VWNYSYQVMQSTLNNCILYDESATLYFFHVDSTLNYCCTPLQPTNGVGNITNAPLFVDIQSEEPNLRLQLNSPCINAGTNYYAPGSTDRDGNPRIVGGRVDMGAYEFQGAGVPPSLTSPTRLTNGTFRFGFSNTPGAPGTVLGTTNVSLPLTQWTVLGVPTETPPASGAFQYTDPSATNYPRRFYRLRWP
jgi:hypothetical protein